MDVPREPPPRNDARHVAITFGALLAWSLVSGGTGIFLVLSRRSDVGWAAVTVGALSLVIALWGLASKRWVQAAFAANYLIAFATILCGAILGYDLYVAVGLLSLPVLTVGACLVARR